MIQHDFMIRVKYAKITGFCTSACHASTPAAGRRTRVQHSDLECTRAVLSCS